MRDLRNLWHKHPIRLRQNVLAIALSLMGSYHKMISLIWLLSQHRGGGLLTGRVGIIRQAINTPHKHSQITLSHMSVGMMRWPLPNGQVGACQMRLNGNTPREAGKVMSNTHGEMMTQLRPMIPLKRRIAIFGKGDFLMIITHKMVFMARLLHNLMPLTPMAYIRCAAMSGNGQHSILKYAH